MRADDRTSTQACMPEFRQQDDACSFGNDAIALHWALADEHLTHFSLVDCAGGRALPIVTPFALTFADGITLGPAAMRVLAPIREEALAANPQASRLAE